MSDDWKTVTATWIGETAFLGDNLQGGTVQMGNLPDQPGVSPMEMLLLGVAGCTGLDIVNILKKQRQQLEKLVVTVRGKRADTHPKVYREIEIVYELWGKQLAAREVERAIALSEEKYCSASAQMRGLATIRTRYQIFESA